MTRRQLLAVVPAAVVLSLPGCGYSLAGRGSFLPANIKTIGVPPFENQTTVFEVDRRIADRVRAELVGRGHFTVLPQSEGADAVLSGVITSITLTPAAFNQQQQATRQVLSLVARMELREVKTGKVLWQNPAQQFSETYELTNVNSVLDANAFLRQDLNALDRLATEFARAVVSAMLEAF
jgi:lipopolysaccharide assembly LptE-like protein